MTLFDLLIALPFASGLVGLLVFRHEAMRRLTTETTGSPDPLRRWLYRYFLFAFWYAIAFVAVSPTALKGLSRLAHAPALSNGTWIWFAFSLLPASLLYWLHRRLARWSDRRKTEARALRAARRDMGRDRARPFSEGR